MAMAMGSIPGECAGDEGGQDWEQASRQPRIFRCRWNETNPFGCKRDERGFPRMGISWGCPCREVGGWCYPSAIHANLGTSMRGG